MTKTGKPLTDAERRAMNDFLRHPDYKGGAADSNALISLEKRGLLFSIERGAGVSPFYYLTKKGRRFQ